MEIEELTKTIPQMIISYQIKTGAPRKWCQSLQGQEELKAANDSENHQREIEELKAANENHQSEIEDLRGENKKSKEVALKLEKQLKKSQRDLEKIKKDLADERERAKDYQQKLEVERKAAADDLLKLRLKNEEQELSKENKSQPKKPSEGRWKYGPLKKGVYRSRLISKPQIPGGKWFL